MRNILWNLTLLAFLSSCNVDYFKIINGSEINSTETPYKLKLVGSSSVIADACSAAISIQRFDSNNHLTTSLLTTLVSLDPNVNGSFYLQSDCSGAAVTTVTIPSGASSLDVFYKNSRSGVKTVVAAGLPVVGSLAISVNSSQPEFSFLKDSFTTDEASVAIGTPITIVRSLSSTAQDVTITGDAISSDPVETDFTPQTLSFAPGETSKTVIFPSFGDSAVYKGDRFYRIKLSAPTNAAILGEKSEAIVNILENQNSPGKFFFSFPLYSASEGAGSVSIRIERTSSGTETINLSTLNGSAVGTTHFGSATQTVTFSGTQKEAIVTIPIVDNTIVGDSKSFYIELKNPIANGAIVTRPWATAKVRIIDNDDATICDDTQTSSFGGGTGVLGDPFLICHLGQMNLISANMNKHFKLMRDLDIETFTPIAGIFSGVFNGNEKVLKNFRYYGGGSGSLFQEIGGNTDVAVTNVNLIQANLTSLGGHAAGLVSQVNSGYSNLSNNLASGLFYARYVAAGILAVTTSDHSLPDKNNFSHGTIYGVTVAGGIMGQGLNTGSPKVLIDHSYSVAAVISAVRSGGIFGEYNYVSNASFELTNSHAKGYVSGYETDSADPDFNSDHAGGLVGGLWTSNNSSILVTNNFYEGKVFGSNRVGGLIAEISTNGPAGATYNVSNNRVQAEIRPITRAGGIVGELDGRHNFTFKNNISSATIIADGDAVIGGLIGRLVWEGVDHPLMDIQNSEFTALGSISSIYGSPHGGIIGGALLSQTARVNLKNLKSYGNISTTTAYDVGGIVGQIINYSPGPDESSTQTTIQNVHSYGNITSRNNAGGIIGYASLEKAPVSELTILSIDSSSSEGNITASQNYAGGFVGGLNQAHNSSFSITNSFSSGNITAPENVAGLVGIVAINSNLAEFTISQSSSRGAISAGPSGYAGGLTGEITCHTAGTILIEKSYASGSVTTGNEDAGGLITGFEFEPGICTADVSNSYSATAITATNWASGIVGYMRGDVSITNSYSVSSLSVTGPDVNGIIVDYGSTPPTLNSTYFMKQAGFNDTIPGSGPKTSAALKLQTTFVGWDFTAGSGIWQFSSGPYQYPTLRENPHH